MRPSEMRLQRDQALACLILALCASIAVFLSVFGGRDTMAIDDAQRRVDLHEGLLRQSAAALQQNEAALAGARAALLAEEGARRR